MNSAPGQHRRSSALQHHGLPLLLHRPCTQVNQDNNNSWLLPAALAHLSSAVPSLSKIGGQLKEITTLQAIQWLGGTESTGYYTLLFSTLPKIPLIESHAYFCCQYIFCIFF
ncbi:hypothetical protein V2J09_009245 [Rumex salicifolius]